MSRLNRNKYAKSDNDFKRKGCYRRQSVSKYSNHELYISQHST